MALPYPNVVVCELVVVLPLGLRPEPEAFANVGLDRWQSFLSKQHRLAQFVQQFVEVAGQTADNCPLDEARPTRAPLKMPLPLFAN